MFLDISLEFLGEYQLPQLNFKDTPVGGLSGLTYDRAIDRFYAISDDRSNFAPARFYTLKLSLNKTNPNKVTIDKVEVENVTFLTQESGETYAKNTVDLEGIALSPRKTLFISSEGITSKGIIPFVAEYDLQSGKIRQNLRIPQRYLASNPEEGKETAPRGVQDNLGFEALTLNPNGLAPEDPFRLFTATESSLLQDTIPDNPEAQTPNRFLHYIINPIGTPSLIAEHIYLLDPAPDDTINNGLTELLALDREGYLLSLERTYGFSGLGAKIFQVINSNATDTSSILSLAENKNKVVPLKKQLILDLSTLGIKLDNLEGMTFGPNLPDGSKTLVLISDNNFQQDQVTQFLLFKIVAK
jgi:hypothetical protein